MIFESVSQAITKMNQIELYSRDTRKANGVFYTPNFLAEYLVRRVLFYRRRPITSVFDPACGDGALLSAFAAQFLKEGAASDVKLVGVDRDINAIISSTARLDSKSATGFKPSFIHADSISPHRENASDGWITLRDEVDCREGFDVALSNPPWGSDLSNHSPDELSKQFTLAKGQFDIYDLFIEIILQNLAPGGVFGLILPDSIFGLEQSNLRRFLATTTKLQLISRLGEGIFSGINRACAVIVGTKLKPAKKHVTTCLRLSADIKKKMLKSNLELDDAQKKHSHRVSQIRFLANENCLFDIDLKDDEVSTFRKMVDTSVPLGAIAISARGAEISKNGKTCRCSHCELWLPLPKAPAARCCHCGGSINLEKVILGNIVLSEGGVGRRKLKVGEDLSRYTSVSQRWIDTMKAGINYKNLNIYKGPKILVRKTGVGITASMDYDEAVTNQVVYMLKIKQAYSSLLSLEFILAILNSRAMTFHLIKKYGENEWRSHPYLTQSALARLPFPRIDFSDEEHKKLILKITATVKKGIEKGGITKIEDIKIERSVAKLFDLTISDYKSIFNTLKHSQQLIPIKRLLNCEPKEIFENGI